MTRTAVGMRLKRTFDVKCYVLHGKHVCHEFLTYIYARLTEQQSILRHA